MCATTHIRVNEKLTQYDDDIKAINKKINATMVFGLISLTGILIELLVLMLRGYI